VRPFSDMVMAPVPLSLAAGAIAQMLIRRVPGVVQVSADRDVTYAEVAYYLSGRVRSSPGLVRPLTTAEAGYPRLFAPAHTTLDTTRLREELRLKPPDVWSAIDESLAL
jgi:dTDP-4-dehydrorhamnose reductase